MRWKEFRAASWPSIKTVPLKVSPTLTSTRVTVYNSIYNERILIVPGMYYAAVACYKNGKVRLNFGPDFKHPPPEGFAPYSTIPIPAQNGNKFPEFSEIYCFLKECVGNGEVKEENGNGHVKEEEATPMKE